MSRRGTPLDELYFKWLVRPLDRKWNESFDEEMLRVMHRTPFFYFVPNDQNRAIDGIALRDRFLYEVRVKSSPWEVDGWMNMECSILEMLSAFSERIAYQTNEKPVEWFSVFVQNLGLRENQSAARTRRALQRLNNRTYSHDGKGGLFPLEHPLEDQREVELWYQMSAYIIENYEGAEV